MLDDYAKDLAVQIGAEDQSIYAKQINRIKVLETKTSKEVIKLVREYVKEYSNSNAFAYYEATLRNIVNAGATAITINGVVNRKRRTKTKYRKGKRIEQGTDWSKKQANTISDDECDKNARIYLGMKPDEEFTGKWASMTPNERFCQSLHESFVKAEKHAIEV